MLRRALRGLLAGGFVLAAALSLALGGWHLFRSTAADAVNEPDAATRELMSTPRMITARGRLEPKQRVIKVAGPSQPTVFVNVLAALNVKEGDNVSAGQILGLLDSHNTKQAVVARLQAKLAHAQRQDRRFERLYQQGTASAEERDDHHTRVEITQAELQQAEAELELTVVRAPIGGKVLKIHAYPGEIIGMEGVAELGDTDAMYAVAEVYENDIAQVQVGHRAIIATPALNEELQGTVESVGWKIGKMDVLSTDPAARADARVVEVRIRLDDSAHVAHLTNLQVEVRIAS